MKKFKVALVQHSPKLKNKDENIIKIRDAVEKYTADLYVFGEMFLTGYMCKDDFHRLAEPIDGESVKAILEIAKQNNATIIFGMPEQDSHSKSIYNSCVVVTPSDIHTYRKNYLPNFGPFEEKMYFKPGHELEVFETPVGKLGCFICYDMFFPEIAKIHALKGAEILVCISAGPTATREFFEKVMQARAIENTTFVLFCNLVGSEASIIFFGGSAIISPRGYVKAKANTLREDVVEAELEPSELNVARRFRPTLRDTRHEILELFKNLKARARKKK